jgi:pimeloyl-ACP methyl ester carboxylesterase
MTDIETGLAAFATVVTYDRAGLGKSDPPPGPPTAADMADDLAAVLEALGVARPILLIGCSLSALPVQLFAARRPTAVAALLLLDPTPDEMVAAIADWPAAAQDAARTNLATSANLTSTIALEIECIIESSILVRDTIEALGLPHVPLIVAALDRPGTSPLMEGHSKMALRAPLGRLIKVRGDSHESFQRDHAQLIVAVAKELLGK